MKFIFAITALLPASTLASAVEDSRKLQVSPLYSITYGETTVQQTPTNTVSSVFTHADITDTESNVNPGPYGTVLVKYYQVTNPACYNNANLDGSGCVCSTSVEVESPSTSGNPITAVVLTEDEGTSTDGLAKSTVTDPVATFLDSTARTQTDGDEAYVAYCLRFSLITPTPNSLVANSEDVLIYYKTVNDETTSFGVGATAEGDGNNNPSIGAFTVTAALCSGASPVLEGADVDICITSDDDPAAAITGIDSWTWTYTPSGAAPVTVTQAAITSGQEADLTDLKVCKAQDTSADPSVPKSVCQFTTLFGTAFYNAIGVGNTGTVAGSGTVIMKFNGDNRRHRVLLSTGDLFIKDSSMELTLIGSDDDNDNDDMTFFGWLFSCFGLF